MVGGRIKTGHLYTPHGVSKQALYEKMIAESCMSSSPGYCPGYCLVCRGSDAISDGCSGSDPSVMDALALDAIVWKGGGFL